MGYIGTKKNGAPSMAWNFHVEDLDALEFGARLSASGGAGDTFAMSLLTRIALERSGGVRVIEAGELSRGDAVVATGLAGSVMAFAEKPGPATCFLRAFESIAAGFSHRRVLVCAYEMAGINAYAPLLIGATLGIPVADLDGMGRAIPHMDLTTFALDQVPISPCALVDSSLRSVRFEEFSTSSGERSLRLLMEVFGGWAAFAGYGMDGEQAQSSGIQGSLARALALGREFAYSGDASGLASNIVEKFCSVAEGVTYVGGGRVVHVYWNDPPTRRTTRDHARGTILIRMHNSPERFLRIEAQNEFLLLIEDGKLRAAVPEAICLLDTHTGTPLLSESIVPGYNVEVLILDAPSEWLTTAGVDMLNPGTFGYQVPQEQH